MGYRCPACDAQQADGEHLANHLAFTAMTRGGEHAAWLDEHAPGWGDDSPGELAERVAESAPEIDHEPQDETRPSVGPPTGARSPSGARSGFDDVVDAAVEEVLDEARELTEEMFEPADDEPASGSTDGLGTTCSERASETKEE